MGYTSVEGRRVYGEFYSYGRFGPTEITYEEFRQHRSILSEIPITGEWLSKKFGKSFPSCSFKYTEMRKLDFGKLIEIAILLGIDYRKPRHPTEKDRRALKKAVIGKIDKSI
jgi:hypothetical protein